MPVYVRRYMIGEIEDIKKKEKEAIEGDSSSGAGETASREDIGQAMEQLQKQSGEKQADEEIIKEVFGSEEEQKQQRPQNTKRRSLQNQQKRRRQQKSENQKQKNPDKREESPPKKDSEEDPAKAKDLEQFMDKLQDEM